MTSLGDSRAFAKRAWKARQAAKRRQFFPTMQTFVNMMEWSITSSSFRGLTTSSTFSTLKHTHISISKNYIHRIRFASNGTTPILWKTVRRSHDFQLFANVNRSLQTSIRTKVQKNIMVNSQRNNFHLKIFIRAFS